MAIASFIAGLFGVFTCVIVLVPLAALVLGVLALRQIDEQPQRIQGRGLAIGGIVLGGIGLVIGVMFIVLIALGDSTSTSSDGFFDEFGSARADYFAVGTCTQNPDGVDYADLEPTSCDRPHGGELYHRDDVDPSMDSYPGDDAMFEVAESMCLDEFQGYVGSTYQESRLGVYYFTPDRYTWAAGDREIVCLAFDPSADLPAGSVQGTGI